jgi:predicted TPR repeat methyltransferase
LSNYGKLCTIMYDLDKPRASLDEIKTFIKYVKSKEDTILEPMCGSGRFYIPLLEAGFNITGFDSSTEMLEACKSKCHEKQLSPKIFKADILNFNSEEVYDDVFIPFGSLSILTKEKDIRKSFFSIKKAMVKNGLFIFTTLKPLSDCEELEDWTEKMRYPYDGKQIVCQQKLHFLKPENLLDINLRYQILDDNENVIEEEYQDFPLRIYSSGFILCELLHAGFVKSKRLNTEKSSQFDMYITYNK